VNLELRRDLKEYVPKNAAHESGHMMVLFKANRLSGLDFFPHIDAGDGMLGTLLSSTVSELYASDCVALAAGMVGEMIRLGEYNPKRAAHDEIQIKELGGQSLEQFALKAYEAIQQDLLFFTLLNIEAGRKIFDVLHTDFCLSKGEYQALPEKQTVMTVDDVAKIHSIAESTLESFSRD
jgi:hypothetical protein